MDRIVKVIGIAGVLIGSVGQASAMPWSKHRIATPEIRDYEQKIAMYKSHKKDLQARREDYNNAIDATAAEIDRLKDSIKACKRRYAANEKFLVAETKRTSGRIERVGVHEMTVGARADLRRDDRARAENNVNYGGKKDRLAESVPNPYLEETGYLRK